jgi:hypothetical protein
MHDVTTVDYDTLHKTIRDLYVHHPDGRYYFDFDNVLYNSRSMHHNIAIRDAVCLIPLAQRRILTARSTPESLRKCLSIATEIGYDFTHQEILSGGHDKDDVLAKAAERGRAPMFFFDDNVMHIDLAADRRLDCLSVYWVDHFPSHRRMWESIKSDSDFPFLSNNGGASYVYQECFDRVSLAGEKLALRTRFYGTC